MVSIKKEVVNIGSNGECNRWKVSLIKTIDDRQPVFYRLSNVDTLETCDIPAYRILDEIVNKKKDILNLRCENNQPIVINDDGYESTDEIIVTDEFAITQLDEQQDESIDYDIHRNVPDLVEWSMNQSNNEYGSIAVRMFDEDKNDINPGELKIDSRKKIYWTCDKEHTVYCELSSLIVNKCKCKICEIEEKNKTMSLDYWARITNNKKMLDAYDDAYDDTDENELSSKEISWKSKRKVAFEVDADHINKDENEEYSDSSKGKVIEKYVLYDITVKGNVPKWMEVEHKDK